MYRPEFYQFKYTIEQTAAIRDTLKQAGFTEKTKWPAILKEITCIVRHAMIQQDSDARNPRQYAGPISTQRVRFVKALGAAVKAFKALPVEIQFCLFSTPIEIIDPLLVASLRKEERPALQKLLDPTGFPMLLSVAAQQAAMPRLLDNVPKTGAPKDRAVRTAVRELWYVFEFATGAEPTVYTSSYGRKNGDGFAGAFYVFARTALGPLRPDAPETLGSSIHAAYTEWRQLVRRPARRPNIKTRRR